MTKDEKNPSKIAKIASKGLKAGYLPPAEARKASKSARMQRPNKSGGTGKRGK